ncbi:hypothetical protein [Falsiroseomonas oryziterrae]|uniref:hypothetical protein n=1 Tax=Falsiroseomonas oryziterrae TaxID=2911368 RepID=UPI001F28ACBF|nr:hypothetical protein [Roseomonas sp. NPKOSM-4]
MRGRASAYAERCWEALRLFRRCLAATQVALPRREVDQLGGAALRHGPARAVQTLSEFGTIASALWIVTGRVGHLAVLHIHPTGDQIRQSDGGSPRVVRMTKARWGFKGSLWRFSVGVLLLAVAGGPFGQPAAQPLIGSEGIRNALAGRFAGADLANRQFGSGVLGLMGYNMIPDGSANAVQINRTSAGPGDTALTLSQFGFGFTVSEAFPLYLEIYAGYARYDPLLYLGGQDAPRLPVRWNNFTGTLGVGYDIAIAENLWLRPIVNVAGGYAAGDRTLLADLLQLRRGASAAVLEGEHVSAFGLGGALTLAYYDYRPERDIDVELRFTQLRIETFGDTPSIAEARSTARTLGLWTRYRWPTGVEAFGRPMRWVLDGSASWYLGDQRDALGFDWSIKVGGGIEFDTGRWELGAFGINMERVRFIGRYFLGDNGVTGVSFGIGISL